MRHLVEAAFADHIKPMLIRAAAETLGLPAHSLGAVTESTAFRRSLRSSLFFGLSDGARMDVFRRSANLDNEQVWQAYEPSEAKTTGLIEDLRKIYPERSEEHTSELQSLMRISYAVFCLKKKTYKTNK